MLAERYIAELSGERSLLMEMVYRLEDLDTIKEETLERIAEFKQRIQNLDLEMSLIEEDIQGGELYVKL